MKKGIRWSTFSATEMETASNRVDIKGNPEIGIEVKVVNKNGEAVKRYVDVIESEHKILINLKFQWKIDANYKEVDSKQIEYFIKKNDDF